MEKRTVNFSRRPLGVAITTGGKDEEGFHTSTTAYSLLGGRLIREEITDGRDCDGRVSSYWRGEWTGKIRFHVWRTEGQEQRDYAAEAMGY